MVAFEYTANGARFQVGELTIDNPQTTGSSSYLNLKLLKHSTIKTNVPTWDLMMKKHILAKYVQSSTSGFYNERGIC